MIGKLSRKTGIFKHALIILLICSMIVTPFAIKPQKSEAGLVMTAAEFTLGKVGDIALDLVESAFMGALGFVAEKSDGDGLNMVYNFLNNTSFLGDPVKNECDEILNEIKHLNEKISAVQADTKATLNKLFTYEVQGNASRINGELDHTYNTYDRVVKKYQAYMTAVAAYSDSVEKYNASPTNDNRKDMKNKKDDADAKQLDLKNNFDKLDYITDINKIAAMTCRKFPENDKDLLVGVNNNSARLYLDEVWTLLGETAPFGYQQFDAMSAAINDTARPLTQILIVNQIYQQFMTAEYDADFKKAVNNGSILNEGTRDELNKKKTALNVVNANFSEVGIAVTQCLNDISGQYSKELNSMVRPYDLNVKKELDFQETAKHIVELSENTEYKYSSSAKKTKAKMDFYRVSFGDNRYLILKNCDLKEKDFLEYILLNPDDRNFNAYGSYRSQDYLNLLNTKDSSYSMISSENDVLDILKSNSYDTAKNDILKYLKDTGQLTEIYSGSSNYIVSSEKNPKGSGTAYDKNSTVPGAIGSSFEIVYWYSQFYDPYEPQNFKKTVKLNKLGNKNLVVILKQNKGSEEANDVYVHKSDDRGKIEITDSDGNRVPGKVKAGTMLKVKVTLNSDDTDLAKLAWQSDNGKTEDILATADIFNAIKDKDNSYTFTYPMPAQKCRFSATFAASKNDGSGTKDDPYIIGNYSDLYEFVKKCGEAETREEYCAANYVLAANIDLTGRDDIGRDTVFEIFRGTFDGNGYAISGLKKPMFKEIFDGGTVKNLTIVGNKNYKMDKVVFALTNDGTIDGCSVICEDGRYITTTNDRFSLIVGENRPNGIVRNCFSLADVKSNNCAGLVGDNKGSILNCYNLGKIIYDKEAGNGKISGITGFSKNATISNCYYGGGFFDRFYEPTASNFAPIVLDSPPDPAKTNSYYDEKYNLAKHTYGIPLKTEQMNGSDDLLDKLNKEAAEHSTWKGWQRSDDVNGGYPYFGGVPLKYNISRDVKGEGKIAITSADKRIKSAPKDTKIDIALNAGEGYEAESVDIIGKDGAVLESPKIETSGDKVSASFEMPGQDIVISATFTAKDEEKSDYGKRNMIDKSTGVRVYGKQINDNAQLVVKKYAPGSVHEDTMEASIGDDVLASYDIKFVLKDDDGNIIKTDDPTFKDDLYVYFPIKEHYNYEDLNVVHGSNTDYDIVDGKEIQTDSEDLYRVHVKHLSPFALVAHTDEIVENVSAQAEAADESLKNMETAAAVIIIVLLAAGIVVFFLYRRKKKLAVQKQGDK